MVENIERHLHEGKPPFRAAIDAARELVGPIIAMTITLAAVYAPVGIQGGLTGSLFREFAFTLAGAVIVSGVVALTLSPMMGAKLLRAGDTERGFAGWINRRFDSVRHGYTRVSDRHASLSSGRARAVAAGGRADGTVLHVLAAGTRTNRRPGLLLRNRSGGGELHARSDEAVYVSDLRRVSIASGKRQHLSDHVPDRRIRRHDHQAVEPADKDDRAARDGDDGTVVADSGHSRDPDRAAAVAGRRRLSGRFRHRIGSRTRAAERDCRPARSEGVRERVVHLRGRRSEVRPATGRGRLRSRQAPLAGCRPAAGGAGSLNAGRRRLRQSVQHSRAQLQGDSAGQARGAPGAGSARANVRHGLGQQTRAAVDVRQPANHHPAAGAEEIPAAQRGPHPGGDTSPCSPRSGADLPGK